ncbi:MAG: hypothetical protein LJE94_01390 [Deltaproteobacteria bacterium]|nr:hypothetical protein [Deltaproteobacteria bacterium]
MKNLGEYQQEQLEALALVRSHLDGLDAASLAGLEAQCADYLSFRKEVDRFLETYFSGICTEACYRSGMSACCTREGIITFFADVVVNALASPREAVETMHARLVQPHRGNKCLYLGESGCLWHVKPLVCAMFLCDRAENEVLGEDPQLCNTWEELKRREKTFRWPDRAVLFDDLEKVFIDAGHSSTLMYLHNSPGLLKIKKSAQKKKGCPE